MSEAEKKQEELSSSFFTSEDGRKFEIREVWASNLEEEMKKIQVVVEKFPFVAMVSAPLFFALCFSLGVFLDAVMFRLMNALFCSSICFVLFFSHSTRPVLMTLLILTHAFIVKFSFGSFPCDCVMTTICHFPS